jgi:hypothetical protein
MPRSRANILKRRIRKAPRSNRTRAEVGIASGLRISLRRPCPFHGRRRLYTTVCYLAMVVAGPPLGLTCGAAQADIRDTAQLGHRPRAIAPPTRGLAIRSLHSRSAIHPHASRIHQRKHRIRLGLESARYSVSGGGGGNTGLLGKPRAILPALCLPS